MQEIPSKREDTFRYVYDGYEYHIDTTSVHIFRCSTRATTGCRGKVELDALGRVHRSRPHVGHPRNDTIVEESEMRCEMLDRARRTNASFKEIFDDVCRRHPIVAPKFLYPQMRGPMQRARAKVRPAIPENLGGLAECLDTYEPTQRVYRGMVEADDGSVALIFASDPLLAALDRCTEIYVDGTFKVAPNHPPVAQLYTIHMRFKGCGIAAMYVLCSRRTGALYSAIFARLAQLAPGLAQNLRFIMGDYERAAMNALRDVFPEASIHGCWFHFNQALVRRWRQLGLSNARTQILSMAMALPLAPAERFDEGLGLLAEMADALAVDHPAVLRFMQYLRRQWSPLANIVSVHNCPSRTNNIVESFHNEAIKKLGGLHPNIWKFIEHLMDLIASQEIDMIRLDQVGGRARRPRTIRNMARDVVIRDAQHDLGVGRYTLLDFLSRCANRTAGYHLRDRDAQEEEPAEEEAILVQPGVMAAGEPDVNEPVPRRGRRRQGARPRVRARAVPVGENAGDAVAVAQHPRQLAPEVRPAQGLAAAPDFEEVHLLKDPDEDRDIFHLPEDDFEYVPVPEEPVPFHPVDPLPVEELIVDAGAAAAVRPGGTCCVCLILPATHAFVPCGHQCCCSACADRIRVRCPLCRSESMGVFQIRTLDE